MNIVLVVSSMASGGSERVAATLCSAWADRGDRVTLIVTFSGRGECLYPISTRVRLIYLADVAGRRGKGVIAYWRRFWSLRRLMHEIRPDVMMSFLTNVNVAVVAASRGLGIPLIVCERTNPAAENQTSRVLRLLRRLTYRFADLVVVQAADTVGPFRSHCPGVRRIEVVPNPIPPGLTSYRRATPQIGAPSRLLAMGRFSAEKQFSLLIATFARLAAKYPNWELWIWGDGPLRASLEAQVKELDLSGRVHMPGITHQPWTELCKADAFVLSSAFEGFPNALLEAMALGVPSVTFDCPSGPAEISRGGADAVLVPFGDSERLAAALDQIMHDTDFRASLGHRAAISVQERYGLNRVLELWDNLFAIARRAES